MSGKVIESKIHVFGLKSKPFEKVDSNTEIPYSNRENTRGKVIDFETPRIKNRLMNVAISRGLTKDEADTCATDAMDAAVKLMDKMLDKRVLEKTLQSLPEKPMRDFDRRQESLVDYLRADDGLGPWVKAQVLTRPMMRDIAPSAYLGLNSYLQRNSLPEDIHIPKQTEAQRADDPIDEDQVRWARRILRRVERASKAQQNDLG